MYSIDDTAAKLHENELAFASEMSKYIRSLKEQYQKKLPDAARQDAMQALVRTGVIKGENCDERV